MVRGSGGAALLPELLLLCLVLLAAPAAAFHFYIEPGMKQCFIHAPIAGSSSVHAKYHAAIVDKRDRVTSGQSNAGPSPVDGATGDLRLNVLLTTKHVPVHYETLAYNAEDAEFSFPANAVESYTMCFSASFASSPDWQARVELDVEAYSGDPNHRPDGPETGLAYMRGIRAMYGHVDTLVRENAEAATRMAAFEGTAESTHRRVIFWTVVNGAVAVGACLWQVWSLKRFFKDKKIV